MIRFFMCILVLILSTPISNALAQTSKQAPFCRCQPGQSCWPKARDWEALAKQLTGQLVKPTDPMTACRVNATSQTCRSALKKIHNPFFNESHPGGSQSQGWLGAWNHQVSQYAVEAETTHDIVAAVNFARQHQLRLVIKGTGHDYLGRSNAPNSLLIWTHKMREIRFNPSFVPVGCLAGEQPVSAITVGAGSRWLDAYEEATNKHNQYVQGGGCTTVGAAGGFTQGGGFGSFSKKFGTGATGVLQVEVVTAKGETIIANKCQNQDLFWAIRGGGGGTFGVVTKMTLKTHPLPPYFGFLQGTISAKNDEAYKKLLRQFTVFFRENLNNEHWGEQFSFNANNKIEIFLVFQGLNQEQAEKVWQPLQAWLQANHDYTLQIKMITVPPQKVWDYHFWEKNHPEFIKLNTAKGASKGEFWWAPNSKEVSAYWYTYQSWWLPLTLFEDKNVNQLADLFYKASRLAPVSLHINKGLAGAPHDVIKAGRETATHPSAFHSAALVIMGAASNQVYPGVKGSEPNIKEAGKTIQKINQAMQLFIQAAPNAGTYVNEADYFQKDWQKAFWGDNYARLFAIKQKYDPDGLFYCHHCVGSESWTRGGMCRQSIAAGRIEP